MDGLRHEDFAAHLPRGEKRLGLTTKEEQAWCRWYGVEAYGGHGVVVEWGVVARQLDVLRQWGYGALLAC